ncbi:mRNA turnover protein 4 isoform X1 [Vespula squamosa]|uniref:Ribosome assembly factor mrt4 n=1 Tax=Vespula squamosa TaxID=30214 RepID=A0ABD2B7Y9_VESSQ
MPKSKRDKKISLTKTNKKGKLLKQQIVEDIRNCATKYKRIFFISVQNMRNNIMKDLRNELKDSRFFFGKNKIIALALGRTPEVEITKGINVLSNELIGQCGLLFTNLKTKEVLQWMEQHEEQEFARSGFIPEVSLSLTPSPMPLFPHSMEPYLRQLGMPTELQRGVIMLTKDFKLCKEGQPLTPEQAKILKLLGKRLATFKLIPIGVYSAKHGYKRFPPSNNKKENGSEEMEVINDIVTT